MSLPLVSEIQRVSISSDPLHIIVLLVTANVSLSLTALVDSGSAGNFISAALCRQLGLKKEKLPRCYQAQSIIGKPLSCHKISHCTKPIQLQVGMLHSEEISLLILEQPTVDIILRRLWLVQHQPEVHWRTGKILRWGERCFLHCFPALQNMNHKLPPVLVQTTTVESPPEKQSI